MLEEPNQIEIILKRKSLILKTFYINKHFYTERLILCFTLYFIEFNSNEIEYRRTSVRKSCQHTRKCFQALLNCCLISL